MSNHYRHPCANLELHRVATSARAHTRWRLESRLLPADDTGVCGSAA